MLSAIASVHGAKFVRAPMKRLEAKTAANASYALTLQSRIIPLDYLHLSTEELVA